ncbi:MAG: cupin domain-containing protein [Pseudomonadota bacterium]
MNTMNANDIINLLGLKPHPEGGHFRETYRDPEIVNTNRPASTAIYFLLQAGELSRWHKVDAAETWHWYAGAPLRLSIVDQQKQRLDVELGNSLSYGQHPQAVVPKHAWQQAWSRGAWTLVGCTVAPGFEFSGFEMAPEDFDPCS